MLSRSLFPRDIFAELERLQQEFNQPLGFSPNIRGLSRGGFPAMNIGSTQDAVEIFAFAPGIDPSSTQVQLERGVLTIAGERKPETDGQSENVTLHIDERYKGNFRRVISLPDDVNPDAIEAKYTNGVLHVHIPRQAAPQPKRITVG